MWASRVEHFFFVHMCKMDGKAQGYVRLHDDTEEISAFTWVKNNDQTGRIGSPI